MMVVTTSDVNALRAAARATLADALGLAEELGAVSIVEPPREPPTAVLGLLRGSARERTRGLALLLAPRLGLLLAGHRLAPASQDPELAVGCELAERSGAQGEATDAGFALAELLLRARWPAVERLVAVLPQARALRPAQAASFVEGARAQRGSPPCPLSPERLDTLVRRAGSGLDGVLGDIDLERLVAASMQGPRAQTSEALGELAAQLGDERLPRSELLVGERPRGPRPKAKPSSFRW